MKRRELLLATATISFAGLPGLSSAEADAAAQSQTDPVQVSDVSIDLGSVTVTMGTAAMAFQDNTMGFLGQDWTVTVGSREMTLEQGVVGVGNVDEETYAQIRASGVQSARDRSLSPLLSGLDSADLDPSAPVQAQFGPITSDGATVVDQVTATGTVDGVTPENWAEYVTGQDVELGAVQFDTVAVQRGNVNATAESVVAELFPNALSVTSTGGTVEAPGRSIAFENLNTTFRPPEEEAEPHRAALEDIQRSAAEGALTADAMRASVWDSGVTLDNTREVVRNTSFEATVDSVTENGEAVVEDFSTTGTLSELLQLARQRF